MRTHFDYTFTFRTLLAALILTLSVAALPASLHAQSIDLSPGRKEVLPDDLFAKNRTTINKKKEALLDGLGNYLKVRPELKVEIGGYWNSKGTAAAKRKSSEGRAKAVQSLLIKKYGIPSANLTVKAYADASPVAPGTSAEDIAKNRRVEIVALTVSGRLVTNAGVAAGSDAIISFYDKNVQTKAPWDLEFAVARTRQPLFELHRVNTFDRSRAEVTFNDGARVLLGDNSQSLVYGSSETVKGKGPNFELLRGDLSGKSPVNGTLMVKAGTAEIDINSSATRIKTDANGRTVVSVHAGKAKVRGNAAATDLADGFGTVVARGSAPEAAKALPETPQPVSPTETENGATAGVRFTWKGTAPTSRLEIAKDGDMLQVVSAFLTSKTEESTKLDAGVYYWQVIGIDQAGLESKPSTPRRLQILAEGAKLAFDPTKKAKLELTTVKEGFTTTNDNRINVDGVVTPGSKVYVNGSELLDQKSDGSFSKNIQLKRGDNKIIVEATDTDGAENRKTLIVKYVEIPRFRFGVTVAPVFPIQYQSFNAGIGGNINLGYMITQSFGAKVSLGVAGLTNNPILTGANATGITEFFAFDVGLLYDFAPTNTVIPYIEANAGLMAWTGHRYVANEIRSSGVFAPGVGLGVKFGGNGRYFGLGGYYRLILDGNNKLDPVSTESTHGMAELRLVFVFN